MLNAIAGVGMISVGAIGGPAIGTVQDRDLVAKVEQAYPDLAPKILTSKPGVFAESQVVDFSKLDDLVASTDDAKQKADLAAAKTAIADLQGQTKQGALQKIAVLPIMMCLCYLILIGYFRTKGGYSAEVLAGTQAEDEKFTGGVEGPVE